jgi:hypothetical protein
MFKGEQNLAFIEKPYTAADLLKALRSLGIHPSASASV